MTGSINFLIVIVLSFLSSCSIKYVETGNGYRVPKKMAYRLKDKFKLLDRDSTLLSTSAFYFTYGIDTPGGDWFKFYPDGKVIYGYMCSVPQKKGDYKFSFNGYYSIRGNKIFIELLYAQKIYDYLIIEGEIKGDTITFVKDRYGGTGRNIHHFTCGDPKFQPHCMNNKVVKKFKDHALLPPDW